MMALAETNFRLGDRTLADDFYRQALTSARQWPSSIPMTSRLSRRTPTRPGEKQIVGEIRPD